MYEPARAVVWQEAAGDRGSSADLRLYRSLIREAQIFTFS